jgi:hypothetical protein|tara:strand:- start:206 stop:541 length:336 start_codon:yes stop_codon:yes gene_type:complete
MKDLMEYKSDSWIHNLLTADDIKNYLYVTATDSNYFSNKEKYSIVKEETEFNGHNWDTDNDEHYIMLWYGSKLESLISYNLFRCNGNAKLLYNLTTGKYCVLIEKDNVDSF